MRKSIHHLTTLLGVGALAITGCTGVDYDNAFACETGTELNSTTNYTWNFGVQAVDLELREDNGLPMDDTEIHLQAKVFDGGDRTLERETDDQRPAVVHGYLDDEAVQGTHLVLYWEHIFEDKSFSEFADKTLELTVWRNTNGLFGDEKAGVCRTDLSAEDLIARHNEALINFDDGMELFVNEWSSPDSGKPCPIESAIFLVTTEIIPSGVPAQELDVAADADSCAPDSPYSQSFEVAVNDETLPVTIPSWDRPQPPEWREDESPVAKWVDMIVDLGEGQGKFKGTAKNDGPITTLDRNGGSIDNISIDAITDGAQLIVAGERRGKWYAYAVCDLEIDIDSVVGSHNSRLEYRDRDNTGRGFYRIYTDRLDQPVRAVNCKYGPIEDNPYNHELAWRTDFDGSPVVNDAGETMPADGFSGTDLAFDTELYLSLDGTPLSDSVRAEIVD